MAGRRFRVEFTAEQQVFAEQIGAACRSVWNVALEQRREYRRRGAWMNYVPQCKELAEAKAEHSWLTEAPGHCLQQTLKDLDKACREHGTWKVRWRSGRRWAPSFRFPEGSKMAVEQLNRRHARIKLPKLGWVKFRASRRLDGEVIRSATLTRQGRHWYLSVLVEDGVVAVEHPVPQSAVGVDRGVVVAVATSAGQLIDAAFSTPAERRRVTRLQRRLSRCAKGSANRNKVRAQLTDLRARERRRREDFYAKTAHDLARDHALVVLEDLRTRNMTRRAKPVADPDNPGAFLPNGASAKSGLNKSILGKGWHRLELALISAARYTGAEVVKVPAAWTSQRCSVCGHVDPKSRESQAVFRCTHCAYSGHADINAANNILAAGLAVTACEVPRRPAGRRGTLKQEPAGNREELLLQTA